MSEVPKTTEGESRSPKSIITAIVLAFLLGWAGVHRFYLGRVLSGIGMLLTFGGMGIWVTCDIILLVLGRFKDSNGLKLKIGQSGWNIFSKIAVGVGAALVLGSLGLGIFSGFQYVRTKDFLDRSRQVDGTVVGFRTSSGEERGALFPLVQYADQEGRVHQIGSSSGSYPSRYKEGDLVKVRYVDEEPGAGRIDSKWEIWGMTWIYLGMAVSDFFVGVAFLAGGLFLAKVFRKARS